MSSKITNNLPELVENGIISTEIAQRIEAYYQQHNEPDSNKLFTIFGILGGTLIGLGIILITAHNWDHFSRITKLFFAFLPMLIGQFVLGFSIIKNKSAAWKEAATVFLFFSVGACIALISQIYNIPGSLAGFLLLWTLLCVPLLFVTKSKAAIILHLFFCTYYALETGYRVFDSNETIPQLYFLLLLFPLWRYIQIIRSQQPSAVIHILHWLFPLSVTISLPICIEQSEGVGFLQYLLLFGILYNIGQLPYFTNKSAIKNGYQAFGTIGTTIVLLITSFRFMWKHEFDDVIFNSLEFFTAVALFMIASGLLYINSKRFTSQNFNLFYFVFLFFGIIFFIGIINDIVATILINVLLFALGVTTIQIGAKKLDFGLLNFGMLIITAMIICRFFDTNIAFELRGLMFVLVGIGFFTANYFMLKKQKRSELKK